MKTLRKRLALVAVSALGAGLLSVIATPVANAAAADVTANSLFLATTNAETVGPTVTALGGDTALDKSKGFLAVTSSDGASQVAQGIGVGLLSGAVGTGVATRTSQLVFNMKGGAITDRVAIVATNGTLSSVNQAKINIATVTFTNAGANDTVTLATAAAHGILVGDIINVDAQDAKADNAAATVTAVTATTLSYSNGAKVDEDVAAAADNGNFLPTLTFNGSATVALRNNGQNPIIAGVVTPNASATSVTFSAYKGASLTTALPTNGTLIGTWIISLTATDASAAFSASDSPVAITTSATAGVITTSVDAATTGVTAGNPLFIQVIGKNAYSQALASGTYVASATNGATVAWGNAGAATAAGTLSTATVTPDGTDQLRIDPASSLTTSTTVVTITHNGNPVTTKTLTFYGEAKSIKIESVGSGRNGTSIAGNDATAYAIYSYRDSDGNKVPGGGAAFAALSATGVVSTGSSIRSPSRSVQAAAAGAMDNAVEALIGAGTDGIFGFTCLTSSATTTVTIAHTNAISLATLTAPVTVACNGGLGTYTVSTDKASYKVGEIATLTIDAKDTSGNPVSDNTVIAAGSVSIGGGSLVQTIAGTEVFTAGKRTLKAQMTTAGTFNAVVTLDGAVTKSATTGYTVTDGAVSNAEVLSAIVKLIASINDQIALLQKQLRKANRR
ncbi:MAG: hypothetical protein FJW47_05295 [Actinobacteria bacterium]|nr:hypothetical protein [Actinomycetota bacterium]